MSVRTVAITGANRGLGLEAAKALAAAGCRVVALCRSADAASVTAMAIAAEVPAAPPVVFAGGADVTSLPAMQQVAAQVKAACPTGLDALVCNAGVLSPDAMSYGEGAAFTVGTNYFGVRNTADALVPLLTGDARLVHVSSRLGCLRTIHGAAERESLVAEPMTIPQLDELARHYVADAATDGAKARWADRPYSVSKALLNRLAELQAAAAAAGRLGAPNATSVSVVCGCPGYCATDLTGGGGRPANLGGRDMAFLASCQGEEWAAVKGSAGNLFHDGTAMTAWRTASM